MRGSSVFLTLALVAPIAACADVADLRTGSNRLSPAAPAMTAQALPVDGALASLPPEAGAVAAVAERRDEKVFTHTVTLVGDPGAHGSNVIRVEAVPRGLAAASRVSEETITAEMDEDFPGIDMRILSQPITSGVGPLAVASGRASDGTRCVYAWRNLQVDGEAPSFKSLLAMDRPAYTVRARLCRAGVSEERLIAMVSGLRMRADLAGRPVAGAIGPVGADALATAGYGGIVAPSPTVSPRLAAPADIDHVTRPPRPANAAASRVAAPGSFTETRPTARPIPRVADTPVARRPPPAAASPVVVAAPIPMPSS